MSAHRTIQPAIRDETDSSSAVYDLLDPLLGEELPLPPSWRARWLMRRRKHRARGLHRFFPCERSRGGMVRIPKKSKPPNPTPPYETPALSDAA